MQILWNLKLNSILLLVLLIVKFQNVYSDSPQVMSNETIVSISPALEVGTRPFWDNQTNLLYYVDVTNSTVYKYDPVTGQNTRAKVGNGSIGFMFPVEGSNTTFIAALDLQIIQVEWDGRSENATVTKVLAEVDQLGRFNGGKVDPYGRLWAGTMGPDGPDGEVLPRLGVLYSYSNGTLRRQETNIGISNGLAWNTKIHKMYYIDTEILKVFQYDYDPNTGDISNRTSVFDFVENNIGGKPDGLTIDSEDKLWVCAIRGSVLARFDPETGKVLRIIELPTPQVTAVTFGGPNLDVIYVTTARIADVNGTKPGDPAGQTFAINNVGIKGVEDVRFKQ